jgi:hypothetical protein
VAEFIAMCSPVADFLQNPLACVRDLINECDHAGRRRVRRSEMKAFTIDAENNITAFPSRKAAEANLPPTGAVVFTTAAGLQGYLDKFPAGAAVEIWNSLTGATPVTKFKDRAKAATHSIT